MQNGKASTSPSSNNNSLLALSEQLATIRICRERHLFAPKPPSSTKLDEDIPSYYIKQNDKILNSDCYGDCRSMIHHSESSNDFLLFSKQVFQHVCSSSSIPDPTTYKLVSKNEICKQVPIMQSLLFKRQHEYLPPKIVNVPSSSTTSHPLPISKPATGINLPVKALRGNMRNPSPSSNNGKTSSNNSGGSTTNDPMIVDDDEEKPKSSFVTARQLVNNKRKKMGEKNVSDDEKEEEESSSSKQKNLSDIKSSTSNYHPVTSLTANSGKKKFVTPFKDKENSNSNSSNNNNNKTNTSKNSGEKPSKKKKTDDDDGADLSKLFADGVIPEELSHLSPKLIETIANEILDSSISVTWDDIAGLKYAKNSVQEAVIWPLMRPDLFFGLRRPPKGLLLFGPPGTGKTLIGKAIAHESGSTFFSISASSLTSKWVGEGEKLVRTLFALARYFQPSVVFIDEIDSLLSQRTDSDSDSGSRRLKTEFLVQLDGASTNDETDRILIVGATNRPEEIDEAVRRRMQKRLYIPLPSKEGRKEMLTRLLSKNPHVISEDEMNTLVDLTDGYSGSDIKNLCAEASMFAIRDLGSQIKHAAASELRPIEFKDFKAALKSIRPSVAQSDLQRYIEWNKTFGSFDYSESAEESEKGSSSE
ncbi:hypothetical protein C9374_008698 [Naegleria lovaniensis]|uniref:AAA+ ATPase domain-containing protein n=1 Tax=Naegleria lovaniensis TaxID=51637 RepID=A0AA88GIZ4_NAELO|nr:uncharacterized protein C9374_008698 [Naegleria lovaniensis]KAG2378076.1 hypothetical protein C9374_008698 [Naegleria lovaniensis]